MELLLDGRQVVPQPGQTLRQLLVEAGLDSPVLSRRPLAAQIAGETFTLNYVPLRRQDRTALGQETPRRAMEASQGSVRLLRYGDSLGREVYERTALFVLFLAVRRLWPGAVAKMDFTVGDSLHVTLDKTPAFSAADMAPLRQAVAEIVSEDQPLIRSRMQTKEAIAFFRADGQEDKARLLEWRPVPYFDAYRSGDYLDYFYGEMLPSTGYLTVWDLHYGGGNSLFFLYPDHNDPDRVAHFRKMPNFTAVFEESERWGQLMDCEVVADLNELTASGKLRELIRVNEALHERSFSQIADRILARGAKAVLLAGPSSSGKTTSAHRLAVQLRVHGKRPVLMSLDDYYIDRDKILPDENGEVDLEHINTIDTALFRQQLEALLAGEEVELPTFDFKLGKRVMTGKRLSLKEDSMVIIEGLHGLNPVLLPQGLDPNLIFRMYLSPLIPLNLDNHNRIPTTYLRLLRRIVRDHETRGASVAHTLSMWASVRRGEEKWIFPFQENADVIFNSSFVYEPAILKKYIYPLLTAVGPEDPYYSEVRTIVKVLNYVQEADVDNEIPPTSILREFIGGNTFYQA